MVVWGVDFKFGRPWGATFIKQIDVTYDGRRFIWFKSGTTPMSEWMAERKAEIRTLRYAGLLP